MYKNLLTSKNTCTKEIPLKTPNSSSCSKANAALALSTTHQQEPATNYSCPLHHQPNTGISQVNEGSSTSINHEHVDCTENSLVEEHVFEIELDAKNPNEISSSPNVSASINPEHHDCTENGLQSVTKHVFEIQINAENPNEIFLALMYLLLSYPKYLSLLKYITTKVNISMNYKVLLHKSLHKILTLMSEMNKFLQIILELKI